MSVVNLVDQIATLQNATASELAARYVEVFARKPRRRHPDYLRKRIAHRLQENALGGLSRRARAVLEQLAAEIVLPTAPSAPAPTCTTEPRPGTVLQREWHGQTVRVEVAADGFVWNGNRYSSLSAVARAVTGSRWNGKLFFGLVARKAATA